MGRTLALLGGLALATSVWTASGALLSAPREADASPADLRRDDPEESFHAGPVVELEPPTLRGRRRARGEGIRTAFDEAHRAFRLGEHALARDYARHVLALDPGNRDAAQLLRIACDAEHARGHDASRRRIEQQWKAVFADLERTSFVTVATVEFPEDWLDGIAVTRRRAAGDPQGEDENEDDDEAALSGMAGILTTLDTQRVEDLTWENATLDQVVLYLRTLTGLDFLITPNVRAEAWDDVEVTLDLDEVTVATVLDLVTEPWGLLWDVTDACVVVGTPEEVQDPIGTRYFDMQDVVGGVRFGDPEDTTASVPLMKPETLIPWIRERVAERAFSPRWTRIEIRNGIVIVRHRTSVLDSIGRLLEDLRKSLRHPTVSGAPPRPDPSWK